MGEAVRAFIDYKYAQRTGTLRDGGAVTGWQDGTAVQQAIPRYSDHAIAATGASRPLRARSARSWRIKPAISISNSTAATTAQTS